MVTQQREEEIKEPPLWLAGLMKPRWLLCCLIVCEIKMELSSQISDISGDLIPQQFFGIQQGPSTFFLGLSSSWGCSPCWQELPGLCPYLPNSHWSQEPGIIEVCGGKKGWCRYTPRDLIWRFPRGATAKSLQLLPSHFSSLAFSFSPLLPPLRNTESGEGIWVLGMNHLLNTSLLMSLFPLWKLSKESYICNRKPNKVGLF